jgi:DNA polymerase III subunit delta'
MFDNILGNEGLKETLSRLRESGRIPNAMLFSGPAGVGKKLFALEIARSFVCRVSETLQCGSCPACVRVGNWSQPPADDRDEHEKVLFTDHPDVAVITAYKRFILVNAVRALEAEAHFRPFEGRARLFIVDDADRMNDNASNALLKTLEEPAPTSHIVLITSRPDSLLRTIRSRCQTFRFGPVRPEQVAKLLMRDHGFSEPDARLAARAAQGSVGRAAAIDAVKLRERRGEFVAALRSALAHGGFSAVLGVAEKISAANNKERFEDDLDLLQSILRDIWALSAGGGEREITHGDIFHELFEVAGTADRDKLAAAVAEIETIRERLAVNINRKLAADELFARIAA